MKKRAKQKQKLKLNKLTVRALQTNQIRDVRGGWIGGDLSDYCPDTGCITTNANCNITGGN